MNRGLAKLALAAFLAALSLACLGAQSPAAPSQPAGIGSGDWVGTLLLKGKDGASLSGPIRLRLLAPGRGALLDIPEQSMFGYPLDEVGYSKTRLSFQFGALGEEETLRFEGLYLASLGKAPGADPTVPGGIVGTAVSTTWKGSFTLRKAMAEPVEGERPLDLPGAKTKEGEGVGPLLPGTLRLPRRAGGSTALAVLVAGAGPSDRNGNNFNVPGKTDSLKLLAEALARRGVATYRFDKRGSGEAYTLERSSNSMSYALQAEDLASILGHFIQGKEFGRVLVMGMNEGAWVAALALEILAESGMAVDGFAVLGASGKAPRTSLLESLEGLDEATRREAMAILEAIDSGKDYPQPSPSLADFFARERKDWLKEWISLKPDRDIGAADTPVLLVRGEADLQVEEESFNALAAARPGAASRRIPSMNYLLKLVKSEEENYASFSDPRFPIPDALADLLAAFAKAQPAP